jgi:hypothetical protein
MANSQSITSLTEAQKELARYKFKHPRSTNKKLGEKFGWGTNWVNVVRNSEPFKKFIAKLEARKTVAVVARLANFEAETIINGAVAQTYLGDRLNEDIDEQDMVGKKMKDTIAIKAVDSLHRQIERTVKTPGGDDAAGKVNIENMQVNIDTMSMKDLMEYIMKGSLPVVKQIEGGG